MVLLLLTTSLSLRLQKRTAGPLRELPDKVPGVAGPALAERERYGAHFDLDGSLGGFVCLSVGGRESWFVKRSCSHGALIADGDSLYKWLTLYRGGQGRANSCL